ncbi:MAG: hypothetical protein ACLQNE_41220, partial [Thermoguttaceae bacterium]
RKQGWWYYYLYGLGIKEPLGTWLLLGLSAVVALRRRAWLVDSPDVTVHGATVILSAAKDLGRVSARARSFAALRMTVRYTKRGRESY